MSDLEIVGYFRPPHCTERDGIHRWEDWLAANVPEFMATDYRGRDTHALIDKVERLAANTPDVADSLYNWHHDEGENYLKADYDKMLVWADNTPTEIQTSRGIVRAQPYEVAMFSNHLNTHRMPRDVAFLNRRWARAINYHSRDYGPAQLTKGLMMAHFGIERTGY